MFWFTADKNTYKSQQQCAMLNDDLIIDGG